MFKKDSKKTKASEETQKEEIKEALQEEKKAETPDYKQKYLMTLAELENTRKRLQKEKQEMIQFAVENAITEFFSPLDNFENALRFADQTSEEVKKWAMGFQMILTQMKDVLHNHGIVAFHSYGNLFDPHYHEAVEVSETDEVPDGTILEEYNKGYKSTNRTLRPARVRVARAKSESHPESVEISEENNETQEENSIKEGENQ